MTSSVAFHHQHPTLQATPIHQGEGLIQAPPPPRLPTATSLASTVRFPHQQRAMLTGPPARYRALVRRAPACRHRPAKGEGGEGGGALGGVACPTAELLVSLIMPSRGSQMPSLSLLISTLEGMNRVRLVMCVCMRVCTCVCMYVYGIMCIIMYDCGCGEGMFCQG